MLLLVAYLSGASHHQLLAETYLLAGVKVLIAEIACECRRPLKQDAEEALPRTSERLLAALHRAGLKSLSSKQPTLSLSLPNSLVAG
jgi:hypothetical protein